ncbi:MAG: transcriptional regulator [Anaerolineaceae bacterium]|nr:transcriptional regulator [Anaerolineaceae bacterium]
MNKTEDQIMQPIHDIDRVIHAPARLLIMAHLSMVASADFTYLLNQTKLTRGNLSTHLGKLEESHYVRITKEFIDKIPRTLIRLTDEGKSALKKYSDNMLQVVNAILNP